ncbi:protein fem-1 homolog B-like [Tubulanus polymorphus]|uniref:protein fem-1 homolog B-like n=1 Tax=Tubulanus polymorphus TaxID=672921 RepID=UPI003DA478A8
MATDLADRPRQQASVKSSSDSYALTRKVFKAARDGMAISLYALLCSKTPDEIHEALTYQSEEDGQKTTPLIISARNGHARVVRLLLKNFEVDIEQTGTVKFDGFVIEGATSLWCAAGAGCFEVVRILVEFGADVNHATLSNSTPLRAACFDGRLEIVKFLLCHDAKLTIANKYENTCLMISSYKGHHDVVSALLEAGADTDARAHCGATALHFAAECGHLNIVKTLIQHGASFIKNTNNMDPLMVAAENCQTEVVEYFISGSLDNITIERRIEALELMGTVFANDKDHYSIEKAYNYMWLAMVERNAASIGAKTRNQPIAAYRNHVECQSLDELVAIEHDHDSLHMESLVIRERILGEDNAELTHPIIFRGAVFADQALFDRCIALWMHALKLRRRNSRAIGKDLLRFAQVFSQMIHLGVNLNFDDVYLVLEFCINQLEKDWRTKGSWAPTEAMSSMSLSLKGKDPLEYDVHTALYLIALICKIKINKAQEFQVCKLVYRFTQMEIRLKNGFTPLHMAACSTTMVDDFHVADVVGFPSAPITKLLITCGADVNARDNAGNTALHVIVQYDKPISDFLTLHSIIVLLCEYNAHTDLANYRGKSAMETCTTGVAEIILRTMRNVSLKCLAAKVIKKNNVPYKGEIPVPLEEFIELH